VLLLQLIRSCLVGGFRGAFKRVSRLSFLGPLDVVGWEVEGPYNKLNYGSIW